MDTPSRFRRLIDVVGRALERSPAERDGYLASVLADDTPLLDEARRLVQDAEEPSLADVTARVDAIVGGAAAEAVREPAPAPSHIGPYEVVRLLGRGGMGVVYLGRQHEPLRRDVAIKVVRAGLADRDTLARFAAERQALALMQHPGIARVFDAGTTEDGLPYFVMEPVEGHPITEYCDRHRLDLDARLELFAEVCGAVHHAHQRGVIHRDLKPSNVLVVNEDGKATPKVIDFGIAKAVEGMLAEQGAQTRAGSLIGTVDYMSPEQVRGDPEGVDVRTDVYSLGIVLYELVTGRHPFADTALRRGGLVEAQRIILESEPPRPSTSVDTAERRNERAQERATDVRTLRRRVREDLDWIVMRALEKDPERRYPSALDLARDLDRYANDQPVSAGPPSLPYRARKFVRRHRMAVVAASLVVLALVSGSAAAASGFVRASAEARRAETISTFLTDLLASVRPDLDGRAVTVQEILDDARERLRAGEFADDRETEASLALVIGHSYEGLGRFDEALQMLRHSVELRRDELAPDDTRLYESLYRLATVLWKQGELEEALTLRLDIAEMTERVFGAAHPEHAESMSNLGNTYADLGDLDAAAQYLARAVEVGRALPGESGELDLARFLNNLGTVYFDQQAWDRAIEVFQETLEIRARLLGEESDVYAITLVNLANAQLNMGELEAAERSHRRAVELEEEIFGEEHPSTAYAYSGLAEALLQQGRAAEAEPYVRRALETRIATSGGSYWRVAIEHRKLAEVLMATSRLEEAERELRTGWEGLLAASEVTHPRAREVAATMARLQALMGDEVSAGRWAALAQES